MTAAGKLKMTVVPMVPLVVDAVDRDKQMSVLGPDPGA